jgi:hypothetical protein
MLLGGALYYRRLSQMEITLGAVIAQFQTTARTFSGCGTMLITLIYAFKNFMLFKPGTQRINLKKRPVAITLAISGIPQIRAGAPVIQHLHNSYERPHRRTAKDENNAIHAGEIPSSASQVSLVKLGIKVIPRVSVKG